MNWNKELKLKNWNWRFSFPPQIPDIYLRTAAAEVLKGSYRMDKSPPPPPSPPRQGASLEEEAAREAGNLSSAPGRSGLLGLGKAFLVLLLASASAGVALTFWENDLPRDGPVSGPTVSRRRRMLLHTLDTLVYQLSAKKRKTIEKKFRDPVKKFNLWNWNPI